MKAGNVRADGATEANALARLSAVELLEGYRTGRFTPRDVIEDVISALELTNASCNVVVTATYDQARKAADAATAAWSAGQPEGKLTGVPVSIKDLVYVAGVTRARRGARQQGPGADRRRRGRRSAEGGRCDRHLQDHDLRIRLQAYGRQPGVRRHPQSLEHETDQRWIQRRRRGLGGCRMRSARDRHRWGRIDTCAVVVLRRGRHQADLWTGPEVAGLFAAVMGVAGAYRADRAYRRRRSAASASNRDPRFARCRQPAGAGAQL